MRLSGPELFFVDSFLIMNSLTTFHRSIEIFLLHLASVSRALVFPGIYFTKLPNLLPLSLRSYHYRFIMELDERKES